MPTFFTDPTAAKKEQLIRRLKIREIRAFGFSKDGLPLLNGSPVIIEKYDVSGELVESYAFWEGTSEVSMTVSTNERGNKIKTYCYDDMEFHVYDSNQRLIERRLYNEKGRIREWVHYEYEKPSGGIEIRRENSRKYKYLGKSVCKSKFYRYDRNNRKTEESGIDEDGRNAWRMTFGYDLAGNLVSTIFTDADGTTIHSKAWLYNEQGLISEPVIECHGDNLKIRYVYSYEYY